MDLINKDIITPAEQAAKDVAQQAVQQAGQQLAAGVNLAQTDLESILDNYTIEGTFSIRFVKNR
jgi:hypothetical protein